MKISFQLGGGDLHLICALKIVIIKYISLLMALQAYMNLAGKVQVASIEYPFGSWGYNQFDQF